MNPINQILVLSLLAGIVAGQLQEPRTVVSNSKVGKIISGLVASLFDE